MASTEILSTQVSLSPNKDASSTSSGRLLSKLTRSPTSSRRHRNTASVNSSGSDSVSDQLSNLPLASHSQRNQPRPDLLRNTSAPIVPTILNPPRDRDFPRTYSDGTLQQGQLENGRMFEAPLTAPLKPPGSSSSKSGAQDQSMLGLHVTSTNQSVPNYHYQQFYEMSNKRIATLDYMRRSHEGKKFWFNTVQFSKSDISRLPSYTPNRLARRAQNYLLLGLSVPTILDVYPQPHSSNSPATNSILAADLLRSLNVLLTEFDAYQQLHPVDGSHVSTLTRARIPQMFKRAATTSRPRKSSGAVADLGQGAQISPPAMPDQFQHGSHFSLDTTFSTSTLSTASSATTVIGPSSTNNMSTANFSTSSSFPAPGPAEAANSSCLPNEGPYNHLLTPPLPFSPDFYSVFATLCDVLIEVYQRLLQTINTPQACPTHVADSFSKVDARIRKVMVGGIVRDFEGAARESAKRELIGVQKVVLGGLMGT